MSYKLWYLDAWGEELSVIEFSSKDIAIAQMYRAYDDTDWGHNPDTALPHQICGVVITQGDRDKYVDSIGPIQVIEEFKKCLL